MMRIAGWIARVSCVVWIFGGALMFSQATAPAPKAAKPGASGHPAMNEKLPKGTSHVRNVKPGKCKDQTTHGNPVDFEVVDCPNTCELGEPGKPKDFVI